MTPEVQPLGMRAALLGVSSLAPMVPVPDVQAARAGQEMARQLHAEFPARSDADRFFGAPAAGQADLPTIVAERARTPAANRGENEPENRQRRRKLRLYRKSRWLEGMPDLGNYVDVSA